MFFFPEETRTKKLGLLRPDEGKRFLEDCCLEAGITLLYGIWPVDCPEEGRDSFRETASSRKSLSVLLQRAACSGFSAMRRGRRRKLPLRKRDMSIRSWQAVSRDRMPLKRREAYGAGRKRSSFVWKGKREKGCSPFSCRTADCVRDGPDRRMGLHGC